MRSAVNGVLLVDKPGGPTSFDVVATARRLFRTRAIGHAGTLDPMATGVLILLFGEATKLSAVLSGEEKTYLAEVSVGTSTDTLDACGTVTERSSLPIVLDPAAVASALDEELRRTSQRPPAHSALKVQGQRAYALARRGHPVDLEERPVTVRSIQLESLDEARMRVKLRVSKGYYVRSFARDVCRTLGVPGHLSALRRTASGGFGVEDAVPWPPSEAPSLLALAAAARAALPSAVLNPAGVLRARQGKRLTGADFEIAPTDEAVHAWFDAPGTLVALGVGSADGFRVQRGFSDAPPDT